jgi:hypothetical protein
MAALNGADWPCFGCGRVVDGALAACPSCAGDQLTRCVACRCLLDEHTAAGETPALCRWCAEDELEVLGRPAELSA